MEHTNIEWCDSTINGSSGCDGCELWNGSKRTCYAGITHETRWAKGLAISHPHLYSPSFADVKMIPGRFAKAAGWSDLRGVEREGKPWLNGRPRHIFVGDMGDFLSRDVTAEYLKRELLGAVESPKGKRHVWMWLTKRPLRLAELAESWGGLPDNVIAMTTVTSQATYDLRVPQLLRVRATWRMLSIEPMLGPVVLHAGHLHVGFPAHVTAGGSAIAPKLGIHGVIVGGESGRDLSNPARPVPMHPDWPRSLRDQCLTHGPKFFFKQHGEWLADAFRQYRTSSDITWGLVHKDGAFRLVLDRGARDWTQDPVWSDGEQGTTRVGREKAGRVLDGREWNDLPEVQAA